MVPSVPVVIGDDPAMCAELVRWYAALYIGGMGSREKNFYNDLAVRMGYADAAREVQDLYLAKQQRDAAAAVPLEFIDRTSLLGPKERIAEKMREYAASGVTTLSVTPYVGDRESGIADAADRRRGPRPRRSGGMSWLEAIVLGHRPGPHRVPAGLVVGAPADHVGDLLRGGRRRLVHRRHPARHRGRGADLLRQGHLADHVRLVPAALGNAERAADARLQDGLVRDHRLDPDRRSSASSSRTRSARPPATCGSWRSC